MLSTVSETKKRTQFTRWVPAVIAVVAAVPWVMLAAGAPTALLNWVPSAISACAFAVGFITIAVMSIRRPRHTHLLLVGLAALSVIALLYAPALAMGGPIAGAPESVVCPPRTAMCWNYLHAAFTVQAAVLVAAILFASKGLVAWRPGGA